MTTLQPTHYRTNADCVSSDQRTGWIPDWIILRHLTQVG